MRTCGADGLSASDTRGRISSEGKADQDWREGCQPRHARYVAFQMAEVAISRNLFADILRMIGELWPPAFASTA
jgi:hypothetical protein